LKLRWILSGVLKPSGQAFTWAHVRLSKGNTAVDDAVTQAETLGARGKVLMVIANRERNVCLRIRIQAGEKDSVEFVWQAAQRLFLQMKTVYNGAKKKQTARIKF